MAQQPDLMMNDGEAAMRQRQPKHTKQNAVDEGLTHRAHRIANGYPSHTLITEAQSQLE